MMSVVNSPDPNRPELGEKVILPRTSPELWTVLEREWAGNDRQRWKAVCALHLYVRCHWTLDTIGLLFGHAKGHVSRLLRDVKRELAERFVPETDEAARRLKEIDGLEEAELE
jgi:hypothetical protein